MKKVTGIGGILFTCEDPKKQKEWYAQHLGIAPNGIFEWREKENPDRIAKTAMGYFPKGTDYFSPSEKDFMINYRVDDLAALLEQLKKEGVQIVGEMQVYPYGKFGWIIDPEGNKIELWEPVV